MMIMYIYCNIIENNELYVRQKEDAFAENENSSGSLSYVLVKA